MIPHKTDFSNQRQFYFQFSLRSLLLFVTLFGVVVAFSRWLGIYGLLSSLIALNLAAIGISIYQCRKLTTIIWCVTLAIICGGPVLYYFFGKWSVFENSCVLCGKKQHVVHIMDINIIEMERDTDISKWYLKIDPCHHTHQWQFLCGTNFNWGGSWEHIDSFGWFLTPLYRLEEVSKKVDQITFEEILKDYKAMQDDQDRRSSFYNRCNKILSNDTKVQIQL
jgi:hypothetical protein